jgi:hypothetical protein
VKWFSVFASAVLLAALVAGAVTNSSHATSFPPRVPCNADALAAAYHGADRIDSVQSFGCDAGYAYLWATIGTGVHEIGVTDVLRYDPSEQRWKNASRLHYCVDHRLPRYVEFWGCNSN